MSLHALYVDFNSYFASVEQQLQPGLRGRPVGVVPVMADTTCCIAASYEAKAFGVRTGTKVSDAREMCPDIIFVEGRHAEYIKYHHRLVEAVESCTHVERTLSIDEMVCKLTGSQQNPANAVALALRIKRTIAETVGSEIRCSIGIAPNTFLAKVASNMQKPDGCVVIEAHELPERLYALELRDLNGIGRRMEERLSKNGITTVRQLYALNRQQLNAAWGSIEGALMYDKLRGIEPLKSENARRSLGHSHVLPPALRSAQAAFSVLHRLLQKACIRLRSYGLQAGAVHVKVKFLNLPSWDAAGYCSPTDDTLELIQALEQLWQRYPARKSIPYAVGISLSSLNENGIRSRNLFVSEPESRKKLNIALDNLNSRYGKNTVYFGGAYGALRSAPMRIAFNHIPDLDTEGDEMPMEHKPS